MTKSAASPLLLVVDRTELLAVRPHIRIPTALVMTAETGENRLGGSENGARLTIGSNRLQLARQDVDQRRSIAERLAVLDEFFDLAEPFERIRAAIDEALRTGAKAA